MKHPQSLLYAFHLETFWWIETNVFEFINHRRFIRPEWDSVSLSSSLAWKLYWIEVKQRVIPPLIKYQATLLLLQFFQQFLSTLVAKETLLKLNQHPPRRARVIAERESDRILLGTEVFVASLWANVLFYAANYMVGQMGGLYNYSRRRMMARRRGSGYCNKDDVVDLANTSWGVLASNIRRHLYSSIGAGLGSMVSPVWGTLIGTSFGDEWAKKQPEPQLPHQVVSLIRSGMRNVFSIFRIGSAGWLNSFSQQPSNDWNDVSKPHDDLICGCCQTSEFSSDPTSRDRAPISSRACSHTICKACVQQCHLAFLERTSIYDEWIKCPLCNTPRAFSSHDHLVNRSLCVAIAAIEKSQRDGGSKTLP